MVNISAQLEHLALVAIFFAITMMVLSFCLSAAKPLRTYYQGKKLSGLKCGGWSDASGFVFGKNKLGKIRYAPAETDGKHSFVLGGSGTGKTTAILIPCLSHFNGNFFAIDISGDISAAVHHDNSLIFAPCEADTAPYDVFSLLDGLDDHPQEQLEQLEKLAFLLMPDIPGARDAARFFNTEGRKILTASLIAFYYAGLDFTDICRKIISSSAAELFREIDALNNEAATLLIKSFYGVHETNVNGCKQAADGAVKQFALNQNIKNSVRRPTANEIAVTPAVLESQSVFLRIPESLLDVYAPLLRIVVSQLLAYFSNRPLAAKPPIFLALDEFAALNIDGTSIVGALQRLRKRNVSIMVVTQSMAALDRLYGQVTRKDMLNNFSYKVVLHAGDADTQMEIAKMIGHKVEKHYSRTSGPHSSSFTERCEQVWAVDPETLSRLGDDLILIHPAGFERLKKCPFYKFL